MSNVLVINATAFAAGFAIAWVLRARDALAVRRTRGPGSRRVSMNGNGIDPLDESQREFRTIEFLPSLADIGEGPLAPEGDGRVATTTVEQHAWSGTPPYTPAIER